LAAAAGAAAAGEAAGAGVGVACGVEVDWAKAATARQSQPAAMTALKKYFIRHLR
jgi:hypothetical protein